MVFVNNAELLFVMNITDHNQFFSMLPEVGWSFVHGPFTRSVLLSVFDIIKALPLFSYSLCNFSPLGRDLLCI